MLRSFNLDAAYIGKIIIMQERKHLAQHEVEKLLKAAEGTRHKERNRCFIMLVFRHGLRVSEACKMRMSQIDLEGRTLHVQRLKRGLSTSHPLRPDEIRIIKKWLEKRAVGKEVEDWVFLNERGTRLSRGAAWYMIKKCGEEAGLSLPAHPHMLRHACGYALADQGADTRLIQDYIGHRNIKHTVKYTASNPARYEKLWK